MSVDFRDYRASFLVQLSTPLCHGQDDTIVKALLPLAVIGVRLSLRPEVLPNSYVEQLFFTGWISCSAQLVPNTGFCSPFLGTATSRPKMVSGFWVIDAGIYRSCFG